MRGLLLLTLVVIAGGTLLASSLMPAGTGKTLVAGAMSGSGRGWWPRRRGEPVDSGRNTVTVEA